MDGDDMTSHPREGAHSVTKRTLPFRRRDFRAYQARPTSLLLTCSSAWLTNVLRTYFTLTNRQVFPARDILTANRLHSHCLLLIVSSFQNMFLVPVSGCSSILHSLVVLALARSARRGSAVAWIIYCPAMPAPHVVRTRPDTFHS